MDILITLFGVIIFGGACFTLGAYVSGSAWERKYIPAINVVNAARLFVELLRKKDRANIVEPGTVLDLERALDGLEGALDYYEQE